MFSKPTYLIMFGFLAILTGLLLLVAYWGLYPFPTIQLVGYDDVKGLELVDKSYVPGQPIKYYVSYCKKTNGTADVSYAMQDGITFPITETRKGNLPKGCRMHQEVISVLVPETIPPGQYRLLITDDFHPSPFQDIVVHFRTEPFTVLPATTTYAVRINGAPAKLQITSVPVGKATHINAP